MKKVIILIVLALSLCAAAFAFSRDPKAEPVAAQDIYTLGVACPKCYGTIYARFEERLSSTTYGNCSKCHKRFCIRYVWHSGDSRPEIREITQVN